jgi:hypothetical protein
MDVLGTKVEEIEREDNLVLEVSREHIHQEVRDKGNNEDVAHLFSEHVYLKEQAYEDLKKMTQSTPSDEQVEEPAQWDCHKDK